LNAISLVPPAPPISSAQRENYRQEGRCVRCGSHDHWVENRQFHPHSPKSRRRQTARRIPASDQGSDDDSDVSEIWKESYKDLLNGN
ncbi:hypothetical protein ACJ73_07212, partial [Blastomyces percursus]